MDGHKNRADPERYFPKAEPTLEGSLKKMNFLKQHTKIKMQVPLKSQIFDIIEESDSGLTVQEISEKLSLNTKTCAKVLDEMIYKYSNFKATAHRYGKVFVHKYHIAKVTQEIPKEKKEFEEGLEKLSESIQQEIIEIQTQLGEEVKEAISQNLKKETKHNRQRVTLQSYIRALFVVARVKRLRVCSVSDIKDMIKNELEPNAQWVLDKKTVQRIVWKLRNSGIIKELCFRIRLRKDDEHEVSYLGDHHSFIAQDKLLNHKNCTVIYKILAAVPEIENNNPLVFECPAIKNPTNRKPFVPSQNSNKAMANIKGKFLREIVLNQSNAYKKLKCFGGKDNLAQNIETMEKIIKGEDIQEDECGNNAEILSKAYSLAIFTKAIFKLLENLLIFRYKILFSTFKMPICYTALKEILNFPKEKDVFNKYSLAYEGFELMRKEKVDDEVGFCDLEVMTPLNLPKKRKHSLEEMGNQIKKLFVAIERKPGLINIEKLKKFAKGIDTDPNVMFRYLKDLGVILFRNGVWEIKYNSNGHLV